MTRQPSPPRTAAGPTVSILDEHWIEHEQDKCWCPCLRLAIEAETAALDVERLRRALLAADERIVQAFPEERDNLIGPEHDKGRAEYAEAIAAEYARLAAAILDEEAAR